MIGCLVSYNRRGRIYSNIAFVITSGFSLKSIFAQTFRAGTCICTLFELKHLTKTAILVLEQRSSIKYVFSLSKIYLKHHKASEISYSSIDAKHLSAMVDNLKI
jgi:hypothetical protein